MSDRWRHLLKLYGFSPRRRIYLRGHQFTDSEGRYPLETIAPGIYPGRTRHIHVRIKSEKHATLTTQLYFPDEPLNEGDFLYQPELLMSVDNSGERPQAQFSFVLTRAVP